MFYFPLQFAVFSAFVYNMSIRIAIIVVVAASKTNTNQDGFFLACVPWALSLVELALKTIILTVLQGIEIVEDRFAGAVQLHSAFQKTVLADQEFRGLMHPEVVGRQVHLLKVRTPVRLPLPT